MWLWALVPDHLRLVRLRLSWHYMIQSNATQREPLYLQHHIFSVSDNTVAVVVWSFIAIVEYLCLSQRDDEDVMPAPCFYIHEITTTSSTWLSLEPYIEELIQGRWSRASTSSRLSRSYLKSLGSVFRLCSQAVNSSFKIIPKNLNNIRLYSLVQLHFLSSSCLLEITPKYSCRDSRCSFKELNCLLLSEVAIAHIRSMCGYWMLQWYSVA